MKQLLWAAGLSLVSFGAWADSITFTESYTQKYECTRLDGETECDVHNFNSATLNATLRIPGLGGFTFESTDSIELSLGSLSYSFTFEDAEDESAENRAAFVVTEINDNKQVVVVGRLTLSRVGDVLTIVGSHRLLDSSIVADQHTEEAGRFSGGEEGVPFSFSAGPFGPIEAQLYYKGSTTITRRQIGSGEEAETISLANVQVMGAADFTPPKARLIFPKPNSVLRACSNSVDFVIEATDNVSVNEVKAAVGGTNVDDYVSAELDEETGLWRVPLELNPGSNSVGIIVVDQDGNTSPRTPFKITLVIAKPLTLEISPGGAVLGATNTQLLEPGRTFKLTARPEKNYLFRDWRVISEVTGTRTETNQILNFTMETNLVIHANFVTNKFLAIDGAYQGLFAATNSEGQPAVAITNSGFLSLTLTDRGRLSGKLLLGNATYPFTGGSDLEGNAHLVIAPANQSQIVMDLVFDVDDNEGNDGVSGVVSRDGWTATLRAAPVTTRSGPLAGKYTFLIPGGPEDHAATEPAGDGAATATLTPAGTLTISGALGDGTVLNGATPISARGEWPIFKSLYGGQGLLWGWAQLSTNLPQLTASHLAWIKLPGVPLNALYTNGFSVTRTLTGARYAAPLPDSNVVVWPDTNGVVALDGGNLGQSLVSPIGLARNKISVLDGNTNRLNLAISPASGVVSGSFIHPATAKPAQLKGVILQLPSPDGIAGGWFKGTNQSGYFRLHYSAPPP